MKKLFALLSVVSTLFFGAPAVLAAPFNAADNNPQVVAYYPTGDHGVVGENATHTGQDLVMEASVGAHKDPLTNDAKVTQQWFYGQANEGQNGSTITEGDHSVFMLSKDGTCQNGWYVLSNVNTNPNNFWGDYLTTGATYCVRTNDFHSSEHHTP